MKRALSVGAGSLLLLTVGMGGVSSAAAAPQEEGRAQHGSSAPAALQDHRATTEPAARADVRCDHIVNRGKSWSANCRVVRGQHAAWTKCSDGTQIVGRFVGAGYWRFGGNCSGHGTVRNWSVV